MRFAFVFVLVAQSSMPWIAQARYWSGLSFPSPGDLPDLGIRPISLSLQAHSLPVRFTAKSLQSCLTLCDPWTVGYQAPQSMEFSRQEHWSGLPFPSPGDLPDLGIKPVSPALSGIVYH